MDVNKTSSASESSATGDANKKPSIAQEPFDNADSDADLILRTSDKVDFYVHKIFLRKASPIFADMFIVGHHDRSMTAVVSNQPSSLPVVDVEEPSSTINSLLRVCYPVEEVKETSIEQVSDVLKAALKYDMQKAIANVKRELLTYIPTDPISVYAIACTLDMEDGAKPAAEEWRKQYDAKWPQKKCSNCTYAGPGTNSNSCPDCGGQLEATYTSSDFSTSVGGRTYRDVLQRSTAGHFHRLIQFVISGVYTSFCFPPQQVASSSLRSPLFNGIIAAMTMDLLIANAPVSDITIQSIDHVNLPTHTFILVYASASAILSKKLPNSSVIHLDEDSTVLATLLQLCYPFAQNRVATKIFTISHIAAVRRAAEKYGMVDAAQSAHDIFQNLTTRFPMQAYLVANQYGWDSEARLAEIRCLALEDIEGTLAYTKEMELVSARVYRNLLKSWYDNKKRLKKVAF